MWSAELIEVAQPIARCGEARPRYDCRRDQPTNLPSCKSESLPDSSYMERMAGILHMFTEMGNVILSCPFSEQETPPMLIRLNWLLTVSELWYWH